MRFVCVCACPSGIAHTFMAAEQLKITLKKMGHECKVETQGAMGIENRITAQDVEQADAVILTNDVKIKEKERFLGKPIFEFNSNTIIKKCNKVIDSMIQELK